MKPGDQNPLVVRHAVAAQRFEVVADGHVSLLDYTLEGGRAVFTHTFVPAELRGRGIAEQLVRAALDWARGEKHRVVPACSYVAKFIARHAEFRELLAE